MSKKKVSIIVPARDEAEYIGSCLESLANLQFPAGQLEILVADNGSTDGTTRIAGEYGIPVLDLSAKKTISGVRNGGAAAATGDILVFLDADCTVEPDWLTMASRYFDRPDIACFGSSPGIPNHAGWVEKTWFLVRKISQTRGEREWQESTNMFVPRSVFEQAGGFDETLVTCEDVDLSYRLRKYGKIVFDTRISAVHHREPKTLKEFFFKEKWRGKSNYSGLLQHGVQWKELPSLLLPPYVTLLLAAALVLLLVGQPLFALFGIAIAEFPVLALAWMKIRYCFTVKTYLQLVVLYNVYFIARAASVVWPYTFHVHLRNDQW